MNSEAFKVSLGKLKQACTTNGLVNPTFIMDNARIHYHKGLDKLIQEMNLNIMFHPPYSTFLNQIENVFSVWKNKVIR